MILVRCLFAGVVALLSAGATAHAAELRLLQPFGIFALREPPDPPPPGGPFTYSVTGSAPNWFISQWNIPGEKMSPFLRSTTGDSTVFEAHAAAASVRIVAAGPATTVTLEQNGAILPCSKADGRPREFDLFISPGKLLGPAGGAETNSAGLSVSLAGADSLIETAAIAPRFARIEQDKGCATNKANDMIALILYDKAVRPAQTFFYQLALNRFCGRASVARTRECAGPPPSYNFFSNRSPFGADDFLPLVGAPFIRSGEQQSFRVDVLPRLKQIINAGPPNMDHDVSHWVVDGLYAGQHIYGDVVLSTEWRDFQITATTQ